MSDIFHSSKFSIAWAEDHLAELELQMGNLFKERDSYAHVIEPNEDGTYQLVKLKLTKPLPRSIGGHVIDIVYNLRAALDQAIYSVAVLNNTLSLKGTPFFPIRAKNTDFENALNGVRKFLPQEITDLIRTFKPYKGGNDLIVALNEFCNSNKHATVRPHPMGTVSFSAQGTDFSGKGIQIPCHPKWDSVKNEVILARIRTDAHVAYNCDYSFFIVFSDIEGIDGKEIVSTICEFFHIVNGIVTAIEAECKRLGLC